MSIANGGVPSALAGAARKMGAALMCGMGGDALRYTLELCTADATKSAGSVYGVDPRSWHPDRHGYTLVTFGTRPFPMPDLSSLFRMDFLGGFPMEELMRQRLLPMLFVTLPFLTRVEICAVWARERPEVRSVLMTWLMWLWEYDCRSARQDEDRNKILSLARFDAPRTILQFVKTVGETCETKSDVRRKFNEFVAEKTAARRNPDFLTVEELCRNEDWAKAGLYDRLVPSGGTKPIARLLNEVARRRCGCFAKMVQSGECDKMGLDVGQLFLYLAARGCGCDYSKSKTLKCMKTMARRYPAVMGARDASGDGPLWQLTYSCDVSPLHEVRPLAEYLIANGCDPDEKSSVGLSYNEVLKCATALAYGYNLK